MNSQDHAEIQRLIVTIGERWQKHILAKVRQRTMGRKWLDVAMAVQRRRYAPLARLALMESVNERRQATAPNPAGQPAYPSVHPDPLDNAHAPFVATIVTADDLRRELPRQNPKLEVPTEQSKPQETLEHAAFAGENSPNLRAARPDTRLPIQPPQPGQREQPSTVVPASENQEPPPSVARTDHFPLDARVHKALTGVLDIRIPAVKLFVNQAADWVARHYDADAVTFGNNILFRSGRYNPDDVAGLGLLGHEVTHAAQADWTQTEAPRAPTANLREEQESDALQNERMILQHFSALPSARPMATPITHAPSNGSGSDQGQRSAGPPMQPQTASSTRDLGMQATGDAAALQLTDRQIQQLKDIIYQDLRDRIRTEFERGG